jgi:glucose/arabinose dehydrogenase
MPTARVGGGRHAVAAPGLKVNAFGPGLKHPRWLHVLPNGDVLAAEALQEPATLKTVFDYAMMGTMKRAAAVGTSPKPLHAPPRCRSRRRSRDTRGVSGRAEPASAWRC